MRRSILLAAISLAVFLFLVSQIDGRAPGREPGSRPSEWFWTQRAWPHGKIDYSAYKTAVADARRLASEGGRVGPPWQPAGPDNIGARVTDLAVDPAVPGRLYAAMASGGVFRSDDAGAHWTPIFDDQAALSIGSVAVDPSDPQTLYVGTGEANAGSYSFFGMGLFKSEDGGATWENKGLEETRYIARIVVDPDDGDRVFAACTGELYGPNPERGVYRSLDGGDNWSQVLSVTDSTAAIDLAMNPQDPDVLYAAMWERVRGLNYRRSGGPSSGIWKSADGGDSWSELTVGLPTDSHVGRIGLALCASQPEVLYAIYADDQAYFDGVYKTVNGGASWTRTSDSALSGMYSNFGWWFGNIRVAPDDPNLVFALGLDFYRSTSGGSSWSNTGYSMHVDHHALAFDPHQSGRIYEGNDGGLYRSTNHGQSWSKLNDQPTSQFYAIAVDPQNPERLYGGTQDNGTLRTLSGDVDDWEMILGGDGFYCLVHPQNADRIWAEYQYGGLNRSSNGGGSWSGATSGINSGDRRNWSTPVVMDPSNPETMYYGTHRLYRSGNGSVSWSAISDDLTGGNQGGNFGTLTTIAVAPSDPNTIYVGTDDSRVWVTGDLGAHWTLVSGLLPTRWVTRVAVDPQDADRAVVSFSGLRWDDPLPHLFLTEDRGSHWQAISAGLPELPLNVVLIDPEDPARLYVGGDLGCYTARAPDFDWQVLGTGLPLAPGLDLALHQPSRSLVAGTHGRSMFRLDLSGLTDVEAASAPRAELLPGHPNPFNPTTEIRFRLPVAGHVSLVVFDASGRRVRVLEDAALEAGEHARIWDGRNSEGAIEASGTYFIGLEWGGERHSRKVQLLK